MEDGVMLKYGRVNEKSAGAEFVPVTMAATQAIKAASGRFIYQNAGVATLVDDTTTSIYGVLNTHEHTPTVGDVFACDTDLNGIWRVPVITGTFVEGMKGDYCDLDISGGIQGVDLTVSTRNHVIIVDGDAVNNNWVDVRMNPALWGTLAGSDD